MARRAPPPDPAPCDLGATQRREGFRLQPPPGHPGLCLRHSGERYRIVDVSVVGVKVQANPCDPLPSPGQRWQGCTLEILRALPIPCELEVTRVGPDDAAGATCTVIAFRLVDLPETVERDLTRVLMDIQWGRT